MIFRNFIQLQLIVAVLMMAGCTDNRTAWDRILETGEFRFATTESPATYYLSPMGNLGLEYELATKFADSINAVLKPVIVPNSYNVITAVKYNKAAVGGAALINFSQLGELRFGPPYYQAAQQLVYKRGNRRPPSITDIPNHILNISGVYLDELKDKYPHLIWNAYYDKDIDKLLYMIKTDEIRSAIAGAHVVDIYKHLYPELRVAFDITPPQPLSWVYKKNDEVLHSAITAFFDSLDKTGELERLIEKYYGHIADFDYVDTRTYLQRIKERLPEYKPLFIEIAKRHGLDWTLLAAMSYQESHWQPDARSPTGVRGLMMLTLDTARDIGIDNRLDPEQSVEGGARYFRQILDKIPERIRAPDRTWLALAAYNIGFQHLEDARILTQQQGGDPDRWKDVREYLPLLSEEKWHTQTRYGYARGKEPVRFVNNIRKYQDILRWVLYEENKKKRRQETLEVLFIDSPVL